MNKLIYLNVKVKQKINSNHTFSCYCENLIKRLKAIIETEIVFLQATRSFVLNPLMTNGLSHPYHLDESIFIFRGFRSIFFFHFYFISDENEISKQNSPRWDAAFCGVTSGAIRFAYVP